VDGNHARLRAFHLATPRVSLDGAWIAVGVEVDAVDVAAKVASLASIGVDVLVSAVVRVLASGRASVGRCAAAIDVSGSPRHREGIGPKTVAQDAAHGFLVSCQQVREGSNVQDVHGRRDALHGQEWGLRASVRPRHPLVAVVRGHGGI